LQPGGRERPQWPFGPPHEPPRRSGREPTQKQAIGPSRVTAGYKNCPAVPPRQPHSVAAFQAELLEP
jgi:hypothetical protein